MTSRKYVGMLKASYFWALQPVMISNAPISTAITSLVYYYDI